jgi:hypothetical protein
MNLRVLAAAGVLATGLGAADVASAQTGAGAVSMTVTGNWEPSVGGKMHEGGSGRVLNLVTLVDEKNWTDTHKKAGIMGSAGVGIGITDMMEVVGNVEFGRTNARTLQVGTVANLPLFAEFGDLEYWGVNGGVRVFLSSGGMSPYITGTVGFRRLSEIGGTFTVPAASVTLSQPFFDESTVPTFGGDFGVLFGTTRTKIGLQAGVRWTGGPTASAASFAGTGLENLNDKGARLSLPVGVVVRF